MEIYKEYPCYIPVLNWVLQFTLLIAGLYILNQINSILMWGYLAVSLVFTFLTLATSCRYCLYYGRMCGAFLGKVVPYVFKKGSQKEFAKREKLLKQLFFIQIAFSLIPVIGAVCLLIVSFSFLMLGILILYLVLMTQGNAVIHERFVCAHCEMRVKKLCPIVKMFEKK